MKNSVIAVCVCVLGQILIASTAAFATESVRILDEAAPTIGDPVSVSGRFVVEDKSAGRAWMEARIISDRIVNADNDPEIVTVDRKIPGLVFDAKTGEVRFRPEGSKDVITCGTYVEGGIFTHARVKPSGLCNFVSKIEHRDVDDGMRVKKRTYLMIDFVVDR
jgi:hypothetical protein